MHVIFSVSVLFMLMGLGILSHHFKILDNDSIDGMSKLLINVAMPSMILTSLQKPFAWKLLEQAALTVSSQFLLYGLALLVSLALLRLVRTNKEDRGILEYGTVFGNVAFMGFPVISAIYGADGLFLASLCIVPFSLLAFSLGAWLIARGGSQAFALRWQTFVNPNSIATLVGFLLFLASWKLPNLLNKTLELSGSLTTPLSMILAGYILAGARLGRAFSSFGIYTAVGLRLFILPGIFLFLLSMLGFRGMELAIPVILAAMPAASNTPVMARLYGGNEEVGSAFMALTTLLSIISIPLAGMLASG